MSFDLGKIRKIDGLLHDNEALLLYDLAKQNVNGVIVEIGSFKGKSTVCLANGTKQGYKNKIYAIDPHMGDLSYHEWELSKNSAPSKKEFEHNIVISGVQEFVVPLYLTSKQAYSKVNEPVSLLFIDGDHRYKGVKSDFLNWKKKLNYGGVIAFHDSFSWEGVIKTVNEIVFADKEFICLGFSNSITYFMKVRKQDWIDKALNFAWLKIRKLYVKIVFMHLPKPILFVLKKINSLVMKVFAR